MVMKVALGILLVVLLMIGGCNLILAATSDEPLKESAISRSASADA